MNWRTLILAAVLAALPAGKQLAAATPAPDATGRPAASPGAAAGEIWFCRKCQRPVAPDEVSPPDPGYQNYTHRGCGGRLRRRAPATPAATAVAPAAGPLATRLAVNWTQRPLAECLAELGERAGLRYLGAAPLLAEAPAVTCAGEKSVGEILAEICRQAGVSWNAAPDGTVALAAGGAPAPSPTAIAAGSLQRRLLLFDGRFVGLVAAESDPPRYGTFVEVGRVLRGEPVFLERGSFPSLGSGFAADRLVTFGGNELENLQRGQEGRFTLASLGGQYGPRYSLVSCRLADGTELASPYVPPAGAAWGEEAGGLQLGLLLEDGAFARGRKATARLFFRNCSGEILTLDYGPVPETLWFVFTPRDGGAEREARLRRQEGTAAGGYELAPGEIWLDRVGLGAAATSFSTAGLPPGRYGLAAVFDRPAGAPGAAAWAGRCRSGELEVAIGGASAATPGTPDPALAQRADLVVEATVDDLEPAAYTDRDQPAAATQAIRQVNLRDLRPVRGALPAGRWRPTEVWSPAAGETGRDWQPGERGRFSLVPGLALDPSLESEVPPDVELPPRYRIARYEPLAPAPPAPPKIDARLRELLERLRAGSWTDLRRRGYAVGENGAEVIVHLTRPEPRWFAALAAAVAQAGGQELERFEFDAGSELARVPLARLEEFLAAAGALEGVRETVLNGTPEAR